MTQRWKHWGWQFGIARVLAMSGGITLTGCFAITLTGCFAIAFSGHHASAQIIPDATLGAERSIVAPNANVRTLPAELIEGGALRGTNLFHSFQEFNVGNGQRVYFANPAGIENILSRVTGNNISKILGTLGVNGGANLFLINPNGIIFGQNAQLDIAGSFVASTANSLVLGNGLEFSATNPESPPLLTIRVTPGLQYGTSQPGATIANAGHLAVGKDLTLAAGNLDLEGQLSAGGDLTLFAQDTVRVRDSVTNPLIAASGGQLLVQGNQGVDIFALNHPESGLFSGGDMVLRSANSVIGDAHYQSSSNFRVEQLDGSLGNLESPNDPVFEVAGNFNLANYTGASLQILAGGSVNIPGTVTINGPSGAFNDSSVTLSNGTTLAISGTTRPTLDVRAGTTGFFGTPTPGTPTSANITIANIAFTAPNGLVFLTNQFQPNTALSGNIQITRIRTGNDTNSPFPIFLGDSGSIVVDSRGNITIPNFGSVRTDSRTDKAGDITLIANDSFFMSRSQIYALTFGQGTPGNINIFAGNAVSIANGSIVTDVQPGIGNGGNINIQAGSLSLTDGSQVQSVVRQGRQGNAGNININVRDTITIAGALSGMYSGVASGGVGNGGNISIQAGSLSIDGSLSALQAGTSGQGNAGNIFVQVDDSVSLTNGGLISSSVRPGGTGNSGNIQINAPGSVNVSRSSLLAGVSSDGSGQAGSITVNTGAFRVADNALVDASTSSRDGGNVTINARSVEVTSSGLVRIDSIGEGNAGNLAIAATDSVRVSNGGRVSAISSDTGDGGNLSISTRELNVNGGIVLTGSVGEGNAGNLAIAATNSMTVSNDGLVNTTSLGEGDGGNLSISTGELNVNQGQVITAAGSTGNAGDLAIAATDSVNVSNQGLVTTGSTGAADGGNLSITTGQLNVDGGNVLTAANSTGNSGDLAIAATDSVNVSNQGLVNTTSLGEGDGGNLSISTGQLNVSNQGRVQTTASGSGKAGDSELTASDSIKVSDRGTITTASTGAGDSGNLSINTRQLNVSDPDSVVGTNSFGTGVSGNLAIAATDSVNISNQGLVSTGSTGAGDGGNLSVSTNRLDVSNGELATAAFGQGDAGNLSVIATDSMNVVNQGKVTTSSTQGIAGNLYIETGKLTIDNSFVITDTFGAGDAGDLTVRAADSVEVVDSGRLSANTFGSGNGGDLTIETGKLSILNAGAVLSVVTPNASGNAGTLIVRASDAIAVDGSKLATETYGSGNGGDLTLETRNLSVLNQGEVSTGVFPESSGQAGNLSVTASDSVELIGGSLTTLTTGAGRAGDLTVTTRKFTAQSGGRVEARTAGFDQGGTITINASESIELIGNSDAGITPPSAISAFSDINSFGNAPSGNINLTTGKLMIRDGAQVTTETIGRGDGGNIRVQANSLDITTGGSITSRSQGQGRAGDISVNLNDNLRSSGGIISATSSQSGGGNVNIDASDIRLRNSSLVSTSVFDSTGGGGNININSTVFIALEDSDILANAFDGRGGNITINSPAFLADLFSSGNAVAVGRNPGDFSPFRGNGRVDISAEATGSGTSGTVILPTIDLTRGLTQLPSDLVDAEGLIDRRCSPGGVAQQSSFTVTGRGGLPPSPNEPLRGDAVTAEWISINSEGEKRDRPNSTANPTSTTPQQLVEAQGWVIAPNGQVILTAQAPTVTPQNPGLTFPSCQGSQATIQ